MPAVEQPLQHRHFGRAEAAIGRQHLHHQPISELAQRRLGDGIERLVERGIVEQARTVVPPHRLHLLLEGPAGHGQELGARQPHVAPGLHALERIDFAWVEAGVGHHGQRDHARHGGRTVAADRLHWHARLPRSVQVARWAAASLAGSAAGTVLPLRVLYREYRMPAASRPKVTDSEIHASIFPYSWL